MKDISKIFCPVDFSEPSEVALDFGIDIAAHCSAEVILFHAVDQIEPMPSSVYTFTHELMNQIPHIMEQMKLNAYKALRELIDSHVAGRVPSRYLVEIGDPATSIIRAAENEEADLIVMATHGLSGIKGFFFGSVAEKVLRTAACPVLTLKHR